MKRQQKKFRYAETLVPVFVEAAADLGAQRTESALASWLNEKGIRPGATPKQGAKWHRQRLPEILSRLVDPPALDSRQVAGNDLDWAYVDWDSLKDSQREKLGPRYAATVWFVRTRSYFVSLGELIREEEKLSNHIAYIETVISRLQKAFPIIPQNYPVK